MSSLIFLGTGGGRIVTSLQKRATGGIVLIHKEHQFHIDPGPGALIRAIQYGVKTRKTNVVCLTHVHLDHANDANAIIEAMCDGGTKRRGTLISNPTCIHGHGETFSPIVSKHCLKLLENCIVLRAGESTEIGGIEIIATTTRHEDPLGIGLKFRLQDFTLSLIGDTEPIEELKQHEGSDVVILNVLRPWGKRWPTQMSSDQAAELLSQMKPRAAIITHFGMQMLLAGPEKEAKKIEDASGVRTIAARDGMKIELESLFRKVLK